MSQANVRYPGRKPTARTSKQQILLDAIRRRDGMTYTEMQKLALMMNGYPPEEWDRRDRTGRRVHRGFWSTYLQDIIAEHLRKCEDGKFRLRVKSERELTEHRVLSSPAVRRAFDDRRRAIVAEGGLPPRSIDETTLSITGPQIMFFARDGRNSVTIALDGDMLEQLNAGEN